MFPSIPIRDRSHTHIILLLVIHFFYFFDLIHLSKCRCIRTYVNDPASLCSFFLLIPYFSLSLNFISAELNTPDKLEYNFYPFSNGMAQFRVRAPNDAHLILSGEPNETFPVIEVFIGGWGNTKSVIRYNKMKPDVAEIGTPNILSANDFRGFWIRVTDGVCEFNINKCLN